MTTWQQRFKKGSLRGVPFFIDSADFEVGRRVVEHEFPQEDIPYAEDLGRSMRKGTIEMFVLGDDYMDQKDALISAAEKPGTATLIHPYYGSMKVTCKSLQIRDSKDETRIARLRLTFVESGDLQFPSPAPNTAAKVTTASLTSFQALQALFEKSYAIAKIPYQRMQGVLKALSLATTAIQDARQDINQVANFVQSVSTVLQTLTTIALAPFDLTEELMGVLSFGIFDPTAVDFVPDYKSVYIKLQTLFGYNARVESASSATDAINTFMQIASTITAASVLPLITYDSVDEATSFRDVLLLQIDNLLLNQTLDDATFISLEDLRLQIQSDMDVRLVVLPEVTVISIPQTTPSLVLSNRFYGDTTLESDITARNGIRNPLFVPAVVSLKVLANG